NPFEVFEPVPEIREELIEHPGGRHDHDELQRTPALDEAHGDQQAEEEHDPEDDGAGFRLLAEDHAEDDQQQDEQAVFAIDDRKDRQRRHDITAGEPLGIDIRTLDGDDEEKDEQQAGAQQEIYELFFILRLIADAEGQDGDDGQRRQRVVKFGDQAEPGVPQVYDEVVEDKEGEQEHPGFVPGWHGQVRRL